MNQLFKSLLMIGLVAGLDSCSKTRQPANDISVSIIPEPNEVKVWEGSFTITESISVNLHSDAFQKMGDYLAEVLGIPTIPITVGEDQDAEETIFLGIKEQLPAEGYELEIYFDRISILGGDQAGVFYGIQT